MKMISLILAFGLASFAAVANQTKTTESTVKTYAADTQNTKLTWVGKKVLVDSQHDGTISLKSGSFEVNGDQIAKGEFVIDMKSIKVVDITDAKQNAKLKGHLESDDFFGVDQHPEAKIAINRLKPSKTKGTYDVTGDLTIKGVTAPITFPAEISIKGEELTFRGKVVVDRTKYNVKFGSKKFFENLVGDRIIADTFDVTVDLKAKAQAKTKS